MKRGFTLQHCDDGIILIRFYDLSPEIVHEWAEVVTQLCWQSVQRGHLRILYDVREVGLLSREMCHALFHFATHFPDTFSRSNAILTMPYALGLLEREVRRLPRRSAMTVRLCLSEREALAWLDGRHEEARAV